MGGTTVMKTIAARMLDLRKITYELRPYEWSEEELDAVSAARKLGMEPDRVFKTLVLLGDKTGMLVACIPAPRELDLKVLAAVSGNKSVQMVPVKEIQGLTGYVRGGVSPLGMKKSYPCYVDATAQIIDEIGISAGQRGLELILTGPDLIAATDATLAPLCR
jgi:Cys-tRNA(Pro)/Cys-tRNA(Cys) deacylase